MYAGWVGASLFFVILLAAPPSALANTSPRAQLEDFFRKATTALSQATDRSQAEDAIRRLARPLFDISGAARRALEPEWRTRSLAEREEFTRLFGDHLLRTYISMVRGRLPRGQPPTIRLGAETIDAGGRVALVRTMVRGKDGADVRFDYLMTRAKADWSVSDLIVDGVSLIANYRAQVAQVLRRSSYGALVARLRAGPSADGPPSVPVPAESGATAGRVVPYPAAQRAASRQVEVP